MCGIRAEELPDASDNLVLCSNYEDVLANVVSGKTSDRPVLDAWEQMIYANVPFPEKRGEMCECRIRPTSRHRLMSHDRRRYRRYRPPGEARGREERRFRPRPVADAQGRQAAPSIPRGVYRPAIRGQLCREDWRLAASRNTHLTYIRIYLT
jgi:hypothetical protein